MDRDGGMGRDTDRETERDTDRDGTQTWTGTGTRTCHCISDSALSPISLTTDIGLSSHAWWRS
jgi:hypothetical protein